jgi:hypothetical protein
MLAERHDVVFQNTRQSVHWTLCQGDFPALLADFVKRAARSAPPSPRRQVPPPAGYQQHEETHSPTPPPPHAILFDPFSPAKNPAMWTLTLFTNLFRRLDPGCPCALPTYSRSTMLRVTLLLAGFYVGAGEATGEKEETTLAANTLDLIEAPLDRKWLGRVRRSSSAEPLHEPVYRQARLAPGSWERLQAHPQFG